jgi:ABC-2 type transport system ATP-binding protein
MENVIEVEHLRKTYKDLTAVDDVSFTVRRGEIFGLLGRNGAGKTTTVECVQGLRHATGGTVRVLGLNPATQAQALRKRIGCQLQESAVPDRAKVWEALSLFSSLSPRGTDWRKLMSDWGLQEKAKSSFASLSGGQKQRLFVALALVNEPEVVFLDEMTTGLDPAARRVAWELIRQIRARGATVVLVTHFMDEAEVLCDRLAIIDSGKVIAIDSPRGLIAANVPELRVIFTTEVADLGFLNKVEGVTHLEHNGPRVTVYGRGPVLALVAASLVEHGLVPADLRLEEPSLEDVFLKLTGLAAGTVE